MIYFDNASTTKISDVALQTVNKYLSELFYNPSTNYHEGICVKQDINKAREEILKALRGDGNFIFTSGGTEGDNTALFCSRKKKGSRIIISAGEHAAIYYSALDLKSKGYDVVICPVDINGRVIEDEFVKLINKDTSLISIIHVSNETGAINDVARLNKIAKEINKDVVFHSDGVQAVGKIQVNLRQLGVDLYTVSGHKLHAPKGVGGLYIRKGLNIAPYIIGGGQEGGLRSSTENVASIMAFSQMLVHSVKNLDARREKASALSNEIIKGISSVEGLKMLSIESGSPFILTFSSNKVRGEVMQHALERKGILVGTGSACASNKAGKRIPEALGLNDKYSDGILRVSFSEPNTLEEAKTFVETYINVYGELAKYGN